MQYRILVVGSCRNKVLVPIENMSEFSEKTKVMFFQAPLNQCADTWAVTLNQVSSLSSGIKAVILLIEVFLTGKIWEWSYDKL